MPWRKGPFCFFGIDIESEWRCDWKWRRLAAHIDALDGRTVLDVGSGNGYYLWRMRGAGARLALGVDPTILFLMQYRVAQHFLADPCVHLLPLRGEDLPDNMHCFDTVFSMGVLYHRRNPLEHLAQLHSALRRGGQLVLESLVIDAPGAQVLVPSGRYAQNLDYIQRLAAENGFTVRAEDAVAVRHENDMPIEGAIAVLEKAAD